MKLHTLYISRRTEIFKPVNPGKSFLYIPTLPSKLTYRALNMIDIQNLPKNLETIGLHYIDQVLIDLSSYT